MTERVSELGKFINLITVGINFIHTNFIANMSEKVCRHATENKSVVFGEFSGFSQKRNLVMLSEETVGNRDGGGSHYRIKQAVGASGKRDVIYPHISGTKQRDTISVGDGTPAVVCRRAADHCVSARFAVVYVDPVNDYVTNILNRDARPVCDVHIVAAAVDCLVAVHDELLLEHNRHVVGEDDPKGLCLNDGVSERAGLGSDSIVVGRVCDDVKFSVFSSDSVSAETYGTFSEFLAVALPVRITAPAVIDWISRLARGRVVAKLTP